ncbi:MAG: serine/threonine-protein kinase [Polyangia bacterium]
MSAPSAPQADPWVGRLIEGRYQVLAPLGRGGMGVVYRVEHVTLKKELALKLLLPELGRSDELLARFQREAEAAARLSHSNIIQVTDFGRTEDGQLFLVMELLEGPSLADVLRDGKPLELDRALSIERQILRALEHAHQAGVVHRDLKPDNIVLVERDGQHDVVKLLDFGIAKLSGPDEAPGAEVLTQAGMIYGTPAYLSPEQALGEPIDRRADLYAAGIILYEMLAGHRPFVADSALELVSMQITQKAIPVVQEVPSVSQRLSDAVDRALQKKRDDRWQDALSFLAALDEEGVGTKARAVSLSGRARRAWSGLTLGLQRRLASRGVAHARLVASGILVGIALLLSAGVIFLLRRPAVVALVPGAPATAAPELTKLDLANFERAIRTGRTCRDRKVAADELIATQDRRYLGLLEGARDRRGGFLGLEKINGCMQRELETAIRKLRGAP